jgi:hypothetical protein
MTCQELREGLRAVGLQTRLLELVSGLHRVMDEPGVATRCLAGEPAFTGAQIAAAKDIESAHQALVEELGEPWDKLNTCGETNDLLCRSIPAD